ncbi:MAG: gliding motility-associated C-terminal domain-containing protein [Saprospiraceae bacterium]|nr:gliding motility-associated C-terminal domain-containing protein [Saprospiraceae bacterium]
MSLRIILNINILLLLSNYFFGQPCSVQVPDDVTICTPSLINLNGIPGGPPFNFKWSSNRGYMNTTNLNPGVFVNETTTFTLEAWFLTNINLITNGDFSLGNTGFSTQYAPGTGGAFGLLSNEGQYAIGPNPNAFHTNFAPCQDHTGGGGNMMVINGAAGLQQIWCQNIAVMPNTDYIFSAWAASVNPSSPAILQFSVGGVLLGTPLTLGANCNWRQFYTIWNSGSNTSIQICVTNQNTAASGNDFALDDIFLSELCKVTRSFTVTLSDFTVSANDGFLDCNQTSVSITPQISPPQYYQYQWSTGEITENIQVSQPGLYTLTVTDFSGCTRTVNVSVDRNIIPPSINLLQNLNCNTLISQITNSSHQNNYSYAWTNPDGVTATSTGNNYSAGLSGSYTVTVTDNVNHCTAVSNVLVNIPRYGILYEYQDVINCQNENVSLKITQNTYNQPFLWNGPESLSSTDSVLYVNTPGQYILTTQDAQCPRSDTFFISIDTIHPSLNVSHTALTCVNLVSEFVAVTDVNSIIWTGPEDYYRSGDTVQAILPGLYFVRAIGENFCEAIDSFYLIPDENMPIVTGTYNHINCFNPVANLEMTVNPPESEYYWEVNSQIVEGLTVSSDTAGTFIFIATNADCVFRDTIVIQADTSKPSGILFTETEIDCERKIIIPELTVDSTSIVKWYNSQLEEIEPEFTQPGTYTYSIISGQNGCVRSDALFVSIDTIRPAFEVEISHINCLNLFGQCDIIFKYPAISADLFLNDAELSDLKIDGLNGGLYSIQAVGQNHCEYIRKIEIQVDTLRPEIQIMSDTITCLQPEVLLAVVHSPIKSAIWLFPDNTFHNTLSPSISEGGLYTLTVTGENECQTTRSIEVATDTLSPVLKLKGDTLNCNHPTGIILAETEDDYAQLIWTGPENFTSELSMTNVTIPGTYNVTVSNKNGCESKSSIEIGGDFEKPELTFNFPDTLTCITKEVSLFYTLINDVNISDTKWYARFSNLQSSDQILLVDIPGKYLLELTASNGCKKTDSVDVVQDIRLPDFTLTNDTITCDKPIATAQIQSQNLFSNIIWMENGIAFSSNSLSIQTENPGLFMVSVSGKNGCTASKQIEIIKDTSVINGYVNATLLTCRDSISTVSFQPDSQVSGFDFEWSYSGNPIVENLMFQTKTTGEYTIQLTKQSNGCVNLLRTKVLKNENVPEFFIESVSEAVCDQDFVTLSIRSVQGGTPPYSFSTNNVNRFNINQLTQLAPGFHHVTIRDANECTLTKEIFVERIERLNISTGPDLNIEWNDKDTLKLNINKPEEDIVSIIWSPSVGLSCTDCLNPFVQTNQNMTYSVEVTDKFGCVATDQISVRVRLLKEVTAPNIMSPSGHQSNRLFTLYGKNVLRIDNLQIYSRWGELIYTINDLEPNKPELGWDGTFKSLIVQPGVFIWIATVRFVDESTEVFKGDVTIIH